MGVSVKLLCSCVLAALLAACGNGGRAELQKTGGQLAVEPSLVELGAVALGRETRRTVTLRNNGVAAMTVAMPGELIQEGAIGGGITTDFVVSGLPLTLKSGESTQVEVIFRPAQVGDQAVRVPLTTDSSLAPEVPVRLAGRGVLGLAQLSSDGLDFADVVVGENAVQYLTLANNDRAATEVQVSDLAGRDAHLFRTSVVGTIQLGPEEQSVIRVEFAPGAVGAFEGSISVTPCPTCGPRTVPLSGGGALRVVEMVPGAIDFGDVPQGTTASRQFLLVNKSKEPIRVAALSADGQGPLDVQLQNGVKLPYTMQGDEQLAGLATFQPDSLGARAGKLTFTVSDGAAPTLAFTGMGYGPVADVMPQKLDNMVAILGTTRSSSILITNVGLDPKSLRPLTITRATLQGATAGQWALQLPPLPWTLGEPGAAASIGLSFTPTQDAPSDLVLVLATNDALHPTVEVPLSGLGRALPPCKARLSPAPPVDFGLVPVGQPSTMGFEIVNDGEWDCVLGDAQLGSGAPQFRWPGGVSPAGRQIPPHGRMSVRVQLLADRAGDFVGEVVMYFSDPNAPALRVPLHGQGDSGCFILAPGAIDFGGVQSGCGVGDQNVYARNWCGQAVTLTGVDLASPFSLGAGAPSFPLVIQPNQTVAIPVHYTAGPVGDDVGAISVSTDLTGAPFRAGLTGAAVSGQKRTDAWDQSTPKVDLLFVVDNSGSMGEEHAALQKNLEVLWSRIALANADFHIAVTTTGTYPYTAGWTQCPGGASGGENGRFFPVDGSRPRILTPQTPDVKNMLFQNLDVGLCHWDERFSEPVMAAIGPQLTNSTAADGNAGFLRDDARLGIVAYSDTDDDNDVQNPQPVANVVDALKAAKHGALDLVSFTGIVPFTQCPTAESLAPRYAELAQALGGPLEDICDLAHMGDRLNGALDYLLLPLTSFPLSARPRDPAQIAVTINGKPVTDFSYDAGSGRIVFSQVNAPAPGSHLTATYDVACN